MANKTKFKVDDLRQKTKAELKEIVAAALSSSRRPHSDTPAERATKYLISALRENTFKVLSNRRLDCMEIGEKLRIKPQTARRYRSALLVLRLVPRRVAAPRTEKQKEMMKVKLFKLLRDNPDITLNQIKKSKSNAAISLLYKQRINEAKKAAGIKIEHQHGKGHPAVREKMKLIIMELVTKKGPCTRSEIVEAIGLSSNVIQDNVRMLVLERKLMDCSIPMRSLSVKSRALFDLSNPYIMEKLNNRLLINPSDASSHLRLAKLITSALHNYYGYGANIALGHRLSVSLLPSSVYEMVSIERRIRSARRK